MKGIISLKLNPKIMFNINFSIPKLIKHGCFVSVTSSLCIWAYTVKLSQGHPRDVLVFKDYIWFRKLEIIIPLYSKRNKTMFHSCHLLSSKEHKLNNVLQMIADDIWPSFMFLKFSSEFLKLFYTVNPSLENSMS